MPWPVLTALGTVVPFLREVLERAAADGEPLSDYQDEEDLEGEDDHLNSLQDELSPESGNEYLGLSHSINDIPGPGLGMTMAPPQHSLMAGSHY